MSLPHLYMLDPNSTFNTQLKIFDLGNLFDFPCWDLSPPLLRKSLWSCLLLSFSSSSNLPYPSHGSSFLLQCIFFARLKATPGQYSGLFITLYPTVMITGSYIQYAITSVNVKCHMSYNMKHLIQQNACEVIYFFVFFRTDAIFNKLITCSISINLKKGRSLFPA